MMTNAKKMTKTKKILIAVIAIVVALLIAIDIAASGYLVNYAIGRAGDGGDRNVEEVVVETAETESQIETNRAAQAKVTAEFLKQTPGEQVQITADDGINLSAIAYKQKDGHGVILPINASGSSDTATNSAGSSASNSSATTPISNCWALVIHGYRDTNQTAYVQDMAQHYYDAGFNVLTPDLRASGNSEGNYVGMGWLDRLDILDWIDWIMAQGADAQIVVHGVSMGAATTMMAAGEQTPDAVKCFVEDCGYTSVWDVFGTELSLRFGLPEFPLLYSASAMSSAMAGYSFQEASALEAVKRCDKPMLFIHGTADDFIPFDMMGKLYEAKATGDKEQLVAEGAGHAEAMYELTDAYWDAVFGFEGRYIER